MIETRAGTKSPVQKLAGGLMIAGGLVALDRYGMAGTFAMVVGLYMLGGSQAVWACRRCGGCFPRAFAWPLVLSLLLAGTAAAAPPAKDGGIYGTSRPAAKGPAKLPTAKQKQQAADDAAEKAAHQAIADFNKPEAEWGKIAARREREERIQAQRAAEAAKTPRQKHLEANRRKYDKQKAAAAKRAGKPAPQPTAPPTTDGVFPIKRPGA